MSAERYCCILRTLHKARTDIKSTSTRQELTKKRETVQGKDVCTINYIS